MNLTKLTIIFILICISSYSNAQVFSQFLWDTPGLRGTQADIGPDFVSSGTSSITSAGGVGGTSGLNAGTSPKQDLNFRLLDNPIFNVKGIDISFDYQRDESAGTILRRGNSLTFGSANQISVRYRVYDAAGTGFEVVNSGNAYSIPQDAIFRTYRFVYLPSTGVGSLLVNGSVVWTNDGPDNRDMYWVGAGDIEFGNQIDGSGSNRTIFDNLIMGAVTTSPLPVELISFNADVQEDNTVNLNWRTASEINNNYFTLERSIDGLNWELLNEVKGIGNSSSTTEYKQLDKAPYKGVSYYRLKQTDFDGTEAKVGLIVVEVNNKEQEIIKIYPNPAKNSVTIELNEGDQLLNVYDLSGKEVSKMMNVNSNSNQTLSIENLPKGVYIIITKNGQAKLIKD
jgi:hypothetical protein